MSFFFSSGLFVSLIIDDFEDGATTPASPWGAYSQATGTGTFTAQQTTVLSGSYSGEITSSNDFEVWETVRSSDTDTDYQQLLETNLSQGNSGDNITIRHRVGGTIISEVEFRGNGTIYYDSGSTDNIGSWSSNTKYELTFNYDFPNDQVTVKLDGTPLATRSLLATASGFDGIELIISTEGSTQSASLFVDNLYEI